MSIGEIITTPTGLAVITEILPITIPVGTQKLRQVVSQPLTGGPEVGPEVAPPSSIPGGGIPYRSLEAQAATAYVALVVEAPPVATPSGAWTAAAGAERAGTMQGSGASWGMSASPAAHAWAARAYKSTLNRAIQPSPLIILLT